MTDTAERDGALVVPVPDEGVDEWFDVVVVGGGNAGFCAAHAAVENGARVLLLEKAPAGEAGGNSFYTAGAFRVAFEDVDELVPYLDETSRQRLPDTVLPAYSKADFVADMRRMTGDGCDLDLAEVLVEQSMSVVRWLAGKGMGWRLMYERQAYVDPGGRWRFFGGLALGTEGGGKGLMARHAETAAAAGVTVRYGAAVCGLLYGGDGAVCGVRHRSVDDRERTVGAGAVVLAAGGFEADPGRRERHLGEGWAQAIVRGNPRNTGEVLDMALAAGATPYGDWGTCHSVAWDAGAPPHGGDRELTNQLTRQSYPISVVVNRRGERFLDEGADFRNYTYAKYGREILRQPGGVAFQLFDRKTRPLLRSEEYDSEPITYATADTIAGLADALGIDQTGLIETVAAFNASIVEVPFNPAIKDGRTADVDPRKSNWAVALDTPPYYGYAVGCGITFTFGGVRVDREARVLDGTGRPLPGLHAAGEMVGGLFSGNYPGGTGLTAGAVFGRIAGGGAAASAAQVG